MMLKLFIIYLTFIPFSILPQNIDESWKLYDDTEVARIDITIDPAALQWIFDNIKSDSLHFASIHFINKYIDEAVDSVGFRLRGNTSRDSYKKSFKISFNDFVPGREFYGVDKLNLNGEHNDPSVIRSKLCWDIFNRIGLASSRASFIEVYINNLYYGLYISVEHIDDEFLKKYFADASGNLWKCLWPADLVYLGSDPDLYKFESSGRQAYELKSNEEVNDYGQLARLIRIINNTPDILLPDSLEKILDVSEVLKYLAVNNLTGSWDDYWSNKNNYYLYHNPSENKFHWIPYDYDNTFGISWVNVDWSSANPYNYPKLSGDFRPLAERLMANPQYRNLFTHFLEFYREKIFNLSLWENRIDSLRNLISPSVENDTFYSKEYGFNINDFHLSYSTAYSNQHVIKGLKEYIIDRYNSLPGELNYVQADPLIYNLNWHPEKPAASDTIFISAAAFSKTGISEINIKFTADGSSSSVEFPMINQPAVNTVKIEDADRWVGIIPPLGTGVSGSFKLEVRDLNGTAVSYPRHSPIPVRTPSSAVEGLYVNEFMASNSSTISDSGNYDDWIELYNSSDEDILLSGLFLSDKPDNIIKWQFPADSLIIKAGEYIVIWCDEEQEQGSFHTNFKLSAEGEFIGLTSYDGITVLDSISFGPQKTDTSFGRFPDAADNWQFFPSPTPGTSNIITAIIDEKFVPSKYELTAYPNPFNPLTTIRYSIPENYYQKNNGKDIQVSLAVFDILGNEITTLVNEKKSAGIYEVIFNASGLTSGIYFYRLKAGDLLLTEKLILLK